MARPITLPDGSEAHWRQRSALERWIEVAIDVLDCLDGDADLEGQDIYSGGVTAVVDPDVEGDDFIRGGAGA